MGKYRIDNGVSDMQVGQSVGVQLMVCGQTSGIIYGMNRGLMKDQSPKSLKK